METLLQRELQRNLTAPDGWVTTSKTPHAYASEALQCGRRIALRVMDSQHASEGPGEQLGLHVTLAGFIGRHVHSLVQGALRSAFPGAEGEVKWNMGHVSGRVDSVYPDPLDSKRVVTEIKTLGQWAYQRAFKLGAPPADHVIQAALSGLALKAERIHIIHINRACDAKVPAVQEWVMDMPSDDAELESLRMKNLVEAAKRRVVPEPWYNGQIIDDPERQGWPCSWCPYRVPCVLAGVAEQPRSRFDESTSVLLGGAGDAGLPIVLQP